MKIVNCTIADIPLMLNFYDMARDLQKEKSNHHWLSFDPAAVKTEIEEHRQWKILEDDDTMTCIFLTAFDDPYIWGERNADPAVYIHRIVTHKDHHGKNYMQKIIEWAKEYGKKTGKKFVRMDTWGDNPALVGYYVKCGFTLLETILPEARRNLPSYYNFISLALLEIKID
jgi:GNAT superfamily N-acetyltransferase